MTRCALLSWLGRRPVEASCHTGEAAPGLPRAAFVQLCDDIYPHRNQNVSGVRAVGTHGSAHLDEWRRAFAAAAQPDAQPSALLLSCKTSGARNRVATDHRKRQPPQASRGPQRATESVAPQEAKARTHAGSPKAESYQGRSAATRQARTHDDAVVPRQGCQSAGGPAGPAAQGTTRAALPRAAGPARRTTFI